MQRRYITSLFGLYDNNLTKFNNYFGSTGGCGLGGGYLWPVAVNINGNDKLDQVWPSYPLSAYVVIDTTVLI